MANTISDNDKSYTAALISKAKGHKCGICDQYFTDSEAENEDFHYSKTKHGTEVFIHKHCWNKTYGKGSDLSE